MKSVQIILVILFLFAVVNINAQVAVIANKSVTTSTLSVDEISDIYELKENAWENGDAIVVYTLKSNDDTIDKFYSSLGRSNAKMKKIWLKIQLTGEGIAPKALSSEDDMLQNISSTKGSIGFISANKVTDAVKVLATIN